MQQAVAGFGDPGTLDPGPQDDDPEPEDGDDKKERRLLKSDERSS